MRRMPGSVYTLPVPAILYLSAIKYKNDPGSLADLVVKFAIKGLFFVLVSVSSFCSRNRIISH